MSDSYSNFGSALLENAKRRSPSVFVQRSCLRNLAVSTASIGYPAASSMENTKDPTPGTLKMGRIKSLNQTPR